MATNNLITKSLGGLSIQSGYGEPDHVAKKGTLYMNEETFNLWQNLNDTNLWLPLNKSMYGYMNIYFNTTTTTSMTSAAWASTNGLTEWSSEYMRGFTMTNGKLRLNNYLSGRFKVVMSLSIYENGVDAAYYLGGVSKNNADPAVGFVTSCGIDSANAIIDNMGLSNEVYLEGGDTLEVKLKASATLSKYLFHATLMAFRVGDYR